MCSGLWESRFTKLNYSKKNLRSRRNDQNGNRRVEGLTKSLEPEYSWYEKVYRYLLPTKSDRYLPLKSQRVIIQTSTVSNLHTSRILAKSHTWKQWFTDYATVEREGLSLMNTRQCQHGSWNLWIQQAWDWLVRVCSQLIHVLADAAAIEKHQWTSISHGAQELKMKCTCNLSIRYESMDQSQESKIEEL